jgi:3-keto-5-aminohexanoate cleavage enzyme
MDKLIITVTVDSNMSYPRNPYCPKFDDVEGYVQQYVDAIRAGASIAHIHGVHRLEDKIQADGKRLSRIDFEGWRRMQEGIRSKTDALVQFGIASARLDEKIRLMDYHPDMMSYCYNPHDEHFQPDPDYPANEMYAIHSRDELFEYSRAAYEKKVKVEIEAFQTGAFWNVNYIRKNGILKPDPLWTTLFLGWPGGCWMPPTPQALIFFVDQIPEKTNWNVSVMDPKTQVNILTLAIMMGGHVRVGWEDNPYIRPGEWARSNAQLVENIVEIATKLGREVATPAEARQIIGYDFNQ